MVLKTQNLKSEVLARERFQATLSDSKAQSPLRYLRCHPTFLLTLRVVSAPRSL